MSSAAEDPIVIVGMARTAMGSFQGVLGSMTAPELGAQAIKSAVARAGLKPEDVSEVLMGCVLPAGQGQAPARQAALGAGLPQSVPATTVNKMCGSGMKTVMLAFDGLEDAYDKGRLMGTFAEDTAQHYQFTREAQDNFAIESLKRAKSANEDGSFAKEIVPVAVKSRAGTTEVARDEQPFSAEPSRIPKLKPAFRDGGTVTAANSSSISDGAAALILMRASEAKRRKLKPIARIAGVAGAAQAPAWFTTAPVAAIKTLLENVGWSVSDVDLYEINEAFAVVTMAAMRDLALPHDKVNVHGGACALGHPIGASGARILVTLISALEKRGKTKGVASLCIGGGEATAVAVELLN